MQTITNPKGHTNMGTSHGNVAMDVSCGHPQCIRHMLADLHLHMTCHFQFLFQECGPRCTAVRTHGTQSLPTRMRLAKGSIRHRDWRYQRHPRHRSGRQCQRRRRHHSGMSQRNRHRHRTSTPTSPTSPTTMPPTLGHRTSTPTSPTSPTTMPPTLGPDDIRGPPPRHQRHRHMAQGP